MLDIEKQIVTDEKGEPVAVQIDYSDWAKIERQLESSSDATEETSENTPSLKELSEEIHDHWKGGDGLDYQRRIRAEWNRQRNEVDK